MYVATKTRQKGMSLIEIMLAIGLAAVFVAGALVYYNSARTSTKTLQTIEAVNALNAIIRDQFAVQGHYDGINSAIVARFSTVPDLMRLDGTDNLVHPWSKSSGAIVIGEVRGLGTSSTPSHFYIRLVDIPTLVCANIATSLFKNYGVSVGSATPGDIKGLSSVTDAVNQCYRPDPNEGVILNLVPLNMFRPNINS